MSMSLDGYVADLPSEPDAELRGAVRHQVGDHAVEADGSGSAGAPPFAEGGPDGHREKEKLEAEGDREDDAETLPERKTAPVGRRRR